MSRSNRAVGVTLLAAILCLAAGAPVFAQPDTRYMSYTGPCSTDSACLQNNRFDVTVTFYDTNAATWKSAGFAQVDVGHEAALIYFFSSSNLEMLVKVLDGNAVNGRFWVFAAAATDLGFQLKVRDTKTGWTNEYHNSPGNRPLAINDVAAFIHNGDDDGGDPEPPPPPPLTPDLGGSWSGTVTSNIFGTGTMTATLRQQGNDLDGSVQYNYPGNPSISGTVTGEISGSQVSMLLRPATSLVCDARATGTFNSDRITGQWNVINCSTDQHGTFELTRR